MAFLSKNGKQVGRTKGKANRRTLDLQEKLARCGCDPLIGMAKIAMNNLPCGTCRGELRTKYFLPAGTHADGCGMHAVVKAKRICTCEGIGERTCLSCYGSGWEACSPELRGKMYAELAQYVLPKRKAIEHTGPDGGPVGIKLLVEFTSHA